MAHVSKSMEFLQSDASFMAKERNNKNMMTQIPKPSTWSSSDTDAVINPVLENGRAVRHLPDCCKVWLGAVVGLEHKGMDFPVSTVDRCEEKWAKHYSNHHKILLVGEGDFSFAASLAASFGSASNITATSLDTERGLWKAYDRAVYNIGELMRKGCKVILGVDATAMDSHPCLKGLTFDRIIFNFPFAVMSKNRKTPQVCPQSVLVKEFLKAAMEMLRENGEIHITQRTDGILGELRIEFLAFKQWLELVGVVDFNVCDYPGYSPKWERGSGYNAEYFPSKTYMFRCPHTLPKILPLATTKPASSAVDNVQNFPNANILPYVGAAPSSVYPAQYYTNKNARVQRAINMRNVVAEEKRIKHYSSYHKILLVGEGDFSFSASLAAAFGSASNMTATSLDSEDFLTLNYCKAFLHLKDLKNRGCKVIHGVDATSMTYHPSLMGSTFDRIIFNFPYAGFFNDSSRESKISCHQTLIWMFLENAKHMIGENGEIHITHKTNGFHGQWNIVSLAFQQGLELVGSVNFNASDYPGYGNQYGFGGDKIFNCSHSKTYMFRHPRTAFVSWC